MRGGPPTLLLVSNSPGEVSTFVRPLVEHLCRYRPDWRLQLWLVPCPYATGAETRVVEEWGLPVEVFTPKQSTLRWLRGRGPQTDSGSVIFLGGDPWHALLLKKRFGLPAIGYFHQASGWIRTGWLGGFDGAALGYGAKEEQETQGARVRERWVGDLRVDAVRARLDELPEVDGAGPPVLALFPGSRKLHLQASLGPFLSVFERIGLRYPDWRLLLSASPYVDRDALSEAAARPMNLGLRSQTAELRGDRLITPAGIEIEVAWGQPYRVIKECSAALCLPGTNTAELAIAGKPAVVPLSKLAPVGGGGALGLLERLPSNWPFIELLKERLKLRKKRRISYLALPNQLAGREVYPEFFVDEELGNLFDFLSGLLENTAERHRIGREAREVMGEGGATERLVEMVEARLC